MGFSVTRTVSVPVGGSKSIRVAEVKRPVANSDRMPSSAAAQTDEEILDLYRRSGTPGFHATGTCAMGSDSTSSVVDGDMRVHGVDGVRVVDCSIFPQMLAGVTNASIMAVAMRAADRILELYS